MKLQETKVKSQEMSKFLFTPSGEKTFKSIAREFNKEKDCYEIVVKNEIDIQEEIQRSSNATDLAILKRKYQLTGEIPAQTGGYGDVEQDLTMLPDNIHDLYKARNKLQARFEQLDPELIRAYGDFDNFVTSIYRGVVPEAVKIYQQNKATAAELKKIKESEVKE